MKTKTTTTDFLNPFYQLSCMKKKKAIQKKMRRLPGSYKPHLKNIDCRNDKTKEKQTVTNYIDGLSLLEKIQQYRLK